MGEMIDYIEAYQLLNKYKIDSVDGKYITSLADAVNFAGGKPVVMKVISKKAVHKLRGGFVALDLHTEREISSAFASLSKKGEVVKPYKIFIQRMLPPGIEIIVGGKIDDQFGKFVLLGLGGTYVETFRDFALRLCPVSDFDARSMIEQLKSKTLIAPDDKSRSALARIIIRASKLFYENDISELDINPLMFHDDRYEAVDVRVIKERR